MKLLLDENLSRRVVPFIQAAFPESTQIALLGLEHSTDQDIWRYAKEHDYVIVTKDSDFYEMSLLYGQPPKIVWLKIGNQSKAATIKALTQNSREIEQLLLGENKACIEIYSQN
jgi:predicted nuclease of predicted toxin-antitoxin system